VRPPPLETDTVPVTDRPTYVVVSDSDAGDTESKGGGSATSDAPQRQPCAARTAARTATQRKDLPAPDSAAIAHAGVNTAGARPNLRPPDRSGRTARSAPSSPSFSASTRRFPVGTRARRPPATVTRIAVSAPATLRSADEDAGKLPSPAPRPPAARFITARSQHRRVMRLSRRARSSVISRDGAVTCSTTSNWFHEASMGRFAHARPDPRRLRDRPLHRVSARTRRQDAAVRRRAGLSVTRPAAQPGRVTAGVRARSPGASGRAGAGRSLCHAGRAPRQHHPVDLHRAPARRDVDDARRRRQRQRGRCCPP
jgi:hypothetical protein